MGQVRSLKPQWASVKPSLESGDLQAGGCDPRATLSASWGDGPEALCSLGFLRYPPGTEATWQQLILT